VFADVLGLDLVGAQQPGEVAGGEGVAVPVGPGGVLQLVQALQDGAGVERLGLGRLEQLTAAVAPPESTEDIGAAPAAPEAQQDLELEAQQDIRPGVPTGYDLPLPEGAVSGKGAIAERSAASRDIQQTLFDPPIRRADVRPHIPRPRRYLNPSEDLEYPDIE
jgi:hypothetical protein